MPSRRELAALFRHAAVEASAGKPGLAALARSYRARFDEEFAATVRTGSSAGGWIEDSEGSVSLGYERRLGRVAAGTGYRREADWTGARPRADEVGPTVQGSWSLAAHPLASITVSPALRDRNVELAAGYAVAAWNGIGAWAGRRAVGFGAGRGGTIVLDRHTVDGAGVFLDRPVVGPGLLDALGPARVDIFMARLDHNWRFEHPWLLGMRGSVQPHPRLTVGVNRGIMFGGEGNTSFSIRNLAFMLVGKHAGRAGEYDNQVVAVDFNYRFPSAVLPAAAYLEWGFEDSAGSWKDVPGILAGIELPALPLNGMPAVAVEYVWFDRACCGNPIWYRNWAFQGGWTEGGRLLGHELGGHGSEWSVRANLHLDGARLRLGGAVFRRDRGSENVFAPQRTGRSRGARLHLEYRAARHVDVRFAGEIEDGELDWRRSEMDASVRFLF